MTHNNINTLTFENHDTYVYYVDELLKSQQKVILTPTNVEDTDIVTYTSEEVNLFTNGVNKGVIKFNDFNRSKLLNLNNLITPTIVTIITTDGILMGNYANERILSSIVATTGKQMKTLATYKSGKYANYINVEIQVDYEDTYRIVTISY
jgi:hypothetical protein